VKTWFNRLAREILTGEDLPVRESSGATGNTVAFDKTWQESATLETPDPIGRVVKMLECPKVEDSQVFYVSWLKAEKAAGRVDGQTFRDLSRAEAEYEKRLLNFSCRAPTYDGNPSKVFNWCGELEKHLSRFKCETIPNDAIKRMLLDCIMGKAQSKIVLLKPDGLAFNNYEIGEFIQELLKKFTH